MFSSVSSLRSRVKEPLEIAHRQNKTPTPMAGSVAEDGEPASGRVERGERGGERVKRVEERSKDKGEGLEDTWETRRIHSGERCLSTVVNPLLGLVSCHTS